MSALVTSRTESLIGRQVCGEYIIEEQLRIGPLATEYSAVGIDQGTERYVARVLHRGRGGTPASFRTEMDRVQAIQHRAISPSIAYSVAPWGVTVVSRAVGDCSLRQRLDEHGTLSQSETGWLVCEVAAALDALHGALPSIVHRSLCPQNISLASNGSSVWLEECGLANALAAAGWLGPPTDGYGEPGYLSPDDARGIVDVRSDVFVLACIAYECLTGVRPFPDADASHPEAFTHEPPRVRTSQPQVAADVDTALIRAWHLDGPAIYENASAFAMEFARGLMVEAGRVTPAAALPSKAPPSGPALKSVPHNDDAAPDPEAEAVDAAFDDLWGNRITEDFSDRPPPEVSVAAPLPAAPSTPIARMSVRVPRAPSIPAAARETPTLRGSALASVHPQEPPLPVVTIDPEHVQRVPLRAMLAAPAAPRRSPPPDALEEPDTIAPPSKYNTWAGVASRPGSPVAPPPAADDPAQRATPVLIPRAPALPTRTTPPPPAAERLPSILPQPASAPPPQFVSRRTSVRPIARMTAMPVISTRAASILGGSIVLAAVIVAASHVYIARLSMRQAHRDVQPLPAAAVQAAPPAQAAPPVRAAPPAPAEAAIRPVAATPAPPGETTPPSPAAVLPDHPSDHDVAVAQQQLVSLVGSCLVAPHPNRRVRVQVVYSGATGRAEDATMHGHFAHTASKECIVAAARDVLMPRFSAEQWTWEYSFPAPQP